MPSQLPGYHLPLSEECRLQTLPSVMYVLAMEDP